MKVVLVGLNAKYVHSNLALYDLEAYTQLHLNRELDLSVAEYTINHNMDQILSSLFTKKADIYAFSCYIWNIAETLQIARELKKVAPNSRIWLGGPEVSYESEQRLLDHPYIDLIIRGEGEATFLELMEVMLDENLTSLVDVLGITLRHEESVVATNDRPLLSMDEVPFVYQDLSRFDHKIIYYETSRGCPFSCSYCLSSIGHNVRFRSMELVEKELQFFIDHKIPQVKFVDRTFNCRKEHSRAIWKYITEHDNGITNFHFEVGADLIQEEDLQLFRKMRPGLIQLEIGLQSTNAKTISEIQRTMDIPKLKDTLLTIRSYHNIHQHLDLIAGLPYEDYATFQTSFNDAYAMKPNQLQLGFLKVLKGSYMKEQVENYEIAFQDSQPYEVLSTKWISYEEILELKKVEEIVEAYYNSDQFEHALPYVVSFFETPFAFYHRFGEYYQQQNYYGIGFKRELRYQVLRDFMLQIYDEGFENKKSQETNLTKDNFVAVLDSLLIYDYYLRENAKSRPVWSRGENIDKKSYNEFFRSAGNEEYQLDGKGYDSKTAARRMHIEPIVKAATLWIVEDEWAKISQQAGEKSDQEYVYAVYDYDQRNPLTKDANVTVISKLVE